MNDLRPPGLEFDVVSVHLDLPHQNVKRVDTEFGALAPGSGLAGVQRRKPGTP